MVTRTEREFAGSRRSPGVPPASFRVFVAGVPRAKGSLQAVPIRRKDGRLGTAVFAKGRQKVWEAHLMRSIGEAWKKEPMAGPVSVSLVFFFPRPKRHFRRRKGVEELREDAPFYVGVRPDVDKLSRAVLDALEGIVFRDDSQVVHLSSIKVYAGGLAGPCEQVGVSIHVWEVSEDAELVEEAVSGEASYE